MRRFGIPGRAAAPARCDRALGLGLLRRAELKGCVGQDVPASPPIDVFARWALVATSRAGAPRRQPCTSSTRCGGSIDADGARVRAILATNGPEYWPQASGPSFRHRTRRPSVASAGASLRASQRGGERFHQTSSPTERGASGSTARRYRPSRRCRPEKRAATGSSPSPSPTPHGVQRPTVLRPPIAPQDEPQAKCQGAWTLVTAGSRPPGLLAPRRSGTTGPRRTVRILPPIVADNRRVRRAVGENVRREGHFDRSLVH